MGPKCLADLTVLHLEQVRGPNCIDTFMSMYELLTTQPSCLTVSISACISLKCTDALPDDTVRKINRVRLTVVIVYVNF